MSVKLLIKRGRYNDIITKQLDVGELAITTDTRNLYVGTNLGNTFVGRCEIVNDIYSFNKPSKGQFIYDNVTNTLYLYDGTNYKAINNSNVANLRYVGLYGNVSGISGMDSDGDVLIDTTLYCQTILSNEGVNNITFTGFVESMSNMTLSTNTIYFFPFAVTNPVSFSSIGVICRAGSGSVLRIGIYSNILQTGYSDKPDRLLFSTNTINATNISILYATFSTPVGISKAGVYWIGILNTNASFSTRGADCSSFNFFSSDGVAVYRTLITTSTTLPSIAPSYPTLTFSTNLYPILTFRGRFLTSPTRGELKLMI